MPDNKISLTVVTLSGTHTDTYNIHQKLRHVVEKTWEALNITPSPSDTWELRYNDTVLDQNQSIADSPVGLAEDLRRDVREQIIAGKTDAEIRDSMVNRYGNVILFRPPFKSSTAWVWIAPFVLLLVGGFVAVRIVRQRASLVAGDDSVVETDERTS